MRLFNTMTQRLEAITPRDGKVGIYVCGVTPYDTAHLGHAFVFATFDTLIRVLRARGVAVTFVENVTDIDDPLFAKAAELGNVTWDELAQRETERFLREMAAINVPQPDHFVFASRELPQMFALIEALLAGDWAYQVDGWIYYQTRRDAEFGALAAAAGLRGYETLLNVANERGNDPTDPRKRDPLDFLLWRAAQPGEPQWDSPFGPGRPGWHIECSAMATHYLGPQIDIHGGGTDLIFPHHSCEIAQTEHATGARPYVHHWTHVAMVGLDGTKMSKSLGNLIIVGKLLEEYTPDAVRTLLAMHHYRQEWEYTAPEMRRAQALATLLTEAAAGDATAAAPPTESSVGQARAMFWDAVEDDLRLPAALNALEHLARQTVAGELQAAELPFARGQLRELGGLLGLRLSDE